MNVRVAVIAAPNPAYLNPGMLTVDLAAAGVLARAVPNHAISWYTLHPPDQLGAIHRSVDPSSLPFDWRPLIDEFEDVCHHDLIILWGDFLQARHYLVEDAVDRLVAKTSLRISNQDALELLYRCLLFSDAPLDVLKKIIVFGSTILFNRQTDYARDRYGEYLSRLFRHCAGIWTREPLSAAKIQHLTADYQSSLLGTDAAFLLRDSDVACLPTTSWSTDQPPDRRVGVFCGVRTPVPRGLLSFLQRLTQSLDVEFEWLPWFPVHEWLREVPGHVWLNPLAAGFVLQSRRRIARLMPRGPDHTVGDLLASLPRYRCIVTDTYHLCVNAWRVGTPAVCLGSAGGRPKHQSLHDQKKRVLYDMYDAGDFYVDISSIGKASAKQDLSDTLGKVLNNPQIARAVTSRISSHARSVEQALTQRLSQLVAS